MLQKRCYALTQSRRTVLLSSRRGAGARERASGFGARCPTRRAESVHLYDCFVSPRLHAQVAERFMKHVGLGHLIRVLAAAYKG